LDKDKELSFFPGFGDKEGVIVGGCCDLDYCDWMEKKRIYLIG